MPTRLRSTVKNNKKPSADLDEMFLDDDGALSGEVAIDTGLPIRESEETATPHHHIVIRKNNQQEDTMSDYGECFETSNSNHLTVVLQLSWNRTIWQNVSNEALDTTEVKGRHPTQFTRKY